MSSDLLREAAAKMRERAEAATYGGPRWQTGPDDMHGPAHAVVYPADSDSAVAFAGSEDAEHIASWHPAVALAVADWLDDEAEWIEAGSTSDGGPALVLARAYLGTTWSAVARWVPRGASRPPTQRDRPAAHVSTRSGLARQEEG